MKSTTGEKFDIRLLGDLAWWCDLIDYEGPVLSLFHIENRHLFLCLWVDRVKSGDRWLLFRISEQDLREYLDENKSLREILRASSLILTYLLSEQRRKNIRRVSLDDIAEYLPAPASFFIPKYSTLAARNLASEVTAVYNIQIAGAWFIDDWSEVPRLYKQIYSFNHALNNLRQSAINARVSSGLTIRPFRGGSSVVGLIDDMNNAIPPISRLKVEAISYHSPGYLSLRADPNITSGVEAVMMIVNDPEKRVTLKTLYKALNSTLDDYNLRRLENSAFHESSFPEFENVDKELRERSKLLLNALGHKESTSDLLATNSSLTVAKALIAYAKRIFKLQVFVDDGLITGFGGPRTLEVE